MLLKRIVIPQIVLHHYQPKFESSNLDLGVNMFELQQPWIYPVKLFAASSSSADSTFQLAYRKKASAGWWIKKFGSSVLIFFVHSFWSKGQYLTIIQPFWIFSGSNFIDEWGQRSLISYLAEIWLLTKYCLYGFKIASEKVTAFFQSWVMTDISHSISIFSFLRVIVHFLPRSPSFSSSSSRSNSNLFHSTLKTLTLRGL